MDQDKEMKTQSAGSQASPQPAAEEAAMRASYLPPLMTAQPSNAGSIGMSFGGPGGGPAPSGQGMMPNAGPGNPGMGMPPSGQPAPSGMMPAVPYPAYYGGPCWGGPQVGGMGMPYGWPYGMPFNPNVNLFCDPRNYVWQGMQGGFGGGMMMPFCPPVMPQQHCGHGGGCHGRSMCGCRSACCRRPPCQRGCGCC